MPDCAPTRALRSTQTELLVASWGDQRGGDLGGETYDNLQPVEEEIQECPLLPDLHL